MFGKINQSTFQKLCWKVWLAFFSNAFLSENCNMLRAPGVLFDILPNDGRNYFVFNCSNLLLFPWDRKVKIMTFWEICAFDFVAVFDLILIYTIRCAHMSWRFKSLVQRYVWTEILRTDKKAQRIFLLHAYITKEKGLRVRMIFSGPKGVRTESG